MARREDYITCSNPDCTHTDLIHKHADNNDTSCRAYLCTCRAFVKS